MKGDKPGELPMEQPRVYRLVVNARTAGILHMQIPDSILVRADDVIQ